MRALDIEKIHQEIDQVIYVADAAYILWTDGTATVGKLQKFEAYDKEILFCRALMKALFDKGAEDFFEYWCGTENDCELMDGECIEIVKNEDQMDDDEVVYKLTDKGRAQLEYLKELY